MKRIALVTALFLLALGSVQAQFACGAGFCNNAASSQPSGCTEATNFIARTSGQDATHQAAYTALICGLVNQASTISGTLFSRLDALWMLRGADSTVIRLNLIQNAFNLTANGTITFVADAGVTSNGSTGFYATGFNPTSAGGQFTQNSVSIAMCTTAALPGGFQVALGGYDGAIATQIVVSSPPTLSINQISTSLTGVATTAGLYHGTENNATRTLYFNGASNATDTQATEGLSNIAFFLLARNDGSAVGITTTQYTMFAIGALFSATDAANFRTLVAAYMAAIGSAAC